MLAKLSQFSELHDASSKRWTQLSSFTASLFLLLTQNCEGGVQVVGPSQPVKATVGEDVLLSCRLEPAADASDMSVEWSRDDLDPTFVFVWWDGEELESSKHPSYKGRTSLLVNKLELGEVSLKLSKVKPSDEGKYRCFIPRLGQESTVELVVGIDPFTVVSLAELGRLSSSVVLQCESAGWYPEPELLWLDGEGKLLSAGPPETVRGPDDLYTVSSRVTVEKRHSNTFTCRVQQNNINQSRETRIHVADDFFIVQSSFIWITIGLAVSLVVSIILLILAVVLFVRTRRQNRTMKTLENKQQPANEQERPDIQIDSDEEALTEKLLSDTRVSMKSLEKKNQPETERLKEEEVKQQQQQQRRKEAELDRKKQEVEDKQTEVKHLQEEKQKISDDLKPLREELHKKITELETIRDQLSKSLRLSSLFSSSAMDERLKNQEVQKRILMETENLDKQLRTKMKEFQTKDKECEEKQTELQKLLEEEHKMETELKTVEEKLETIKFQPEKEERKKAEEKMKTLEKELKELEKKLQEEKKKWTETENNLKTELQKKNQKLEKTKAKMNVYDILCNSSATTSINYETGSLSSSSSTSNQLDLKGSITLEEVSRCGPYTSVSRIFPLGSLETTRSSV